MLLSSYYAGPIRDVDLNIILWHINDASQVAIEVQGPWLPVYNDRIARTTMDGKPCLPALQFVLHLYDLTAEFRFGRIVLMPDQTGLKPELFE